MDIIRDTDAKINHSPLFQAYDHHIAVIHSSLNGQYPGTLYSETADGKRLALLATPFNFHFVAGDAQMPYAADYLHRILFETYLRETKRTEAVLFCPDASWHPILEDVFSRHRGLKDVRKRFRLNKALFASAAAALKVPQMVRAALLEEQDCESTVRYPVCRILIDGKSVSFCSAFMLGGGHAELDVGTEDGFRGQGYAKLAAVTLIGELLQRDLEPDWSAWSYRTESQALAKAVGFEPLPDIPAYIWTENDCGKLDF
jgi:hypothetical protein